MIENLEEPVGDTTESVETVPETTEVETGGEFDADKADNIAQFREQYKTLKADLGTYKPSHEFISETFGDIENAKLADTIYRGFSGETFDESEFIKTLEQLSPSRTEQLVKTLASQQAQELAKTEVAKIFGGEVTPDEIALFKRFKESGYGLGEGDDIPDEAKFDADGNPLSEATINYLRDVQRQVKEFNQIKTSEKTEAEQRAAQESQAKIQDALGRFSNDRLKVLDKEFEVYGLNPDANDTADQRAEKDAIKSFIRNGISGLFMEDEQGATNYGSAVTHISQGESLLARRYEPKIEAKLLELVRSKPVSRLLSSLSKQDSQKEERPEINNSGASTTDTSPQTGRVSADDIFKTLTERGILKP